MKKIIYTGFLLLAYMLTSCSGFLDKEPYEDPSAETINDEASAIAMTNAAYQRCSALNCITCVSGARYRRRKQ